MPVVVFADLVRSVPQPLLVVLVHLAPFISGLRHALEIVSWRQSWYRGWLAVATWWAICLFSAPTLRYFLPIVVFLSLHYRKNFKRQPLLTTEQALQTVMSDLMTIQNLTPSPPTTEFSSQFLLRVLVTTYVPFLIITYFIPLRVLLAFTGAIALLIRAPFLTILVAVLSRSAWLRWLLRHIASFVAGTSLPTITLSNQPTSTSPSPVSDLRFLFTIYENQRWWMGLDWTAALLPGERPSWCSAPPAQAPVSPPSAFTLPEPTTINLPSEDGKKIRRTATWFWEEPEWKVVVRTDIAGTSRVERPLPDDSPPAQNSNSRLLKAAGKMRESGIIGNLNTSVEEGSFDGAHEEKEEDRILTDPDGWIYGDNKWEGLGGKGGMGKYTRFRRWTRIAVVCESVDVVDGVSFDDKEHTPVRRSSQKEASTSPTMQSTSRGQPGPSDEIAATGTIARADSNPVEEGSPLRQRLRLALSKSSTRS